MLFLRVYNTKLRGEPSMMWEKKIPTWQVRNSWLSVKFQLIEFLHTFISNCKLYRNTESQSPVLTFKNDVSDGRNLIAFFLTYKSAFTAKNHKYYMFTSVFWKTIHPYGKLFLFLAWAGTNWGIGSLNHKLNSQWVSTSSEISCIYRVCVDLSELCDHFMNFTACTKKKRKKKMRWRNRW